MSRVTLTINLELEMAGLPSEQAMSYAQQRAELIAARVFVCGDKGGKLNFDVEDSDHPVPKSCEAVKILPGRMNATVGKRRTMGVRTGSKLRPLDKETR